MATELITGTETRRRTDVAARAFRAMGSDAEIIVVGGSPDLIDVASGEVERLEQLWSRFRSGSEVTRINQLAGSTVTVDPATALLAQRAVAAWRLTGGGFDPTILGAMLRAGYATSLGPAAGLTASPAAGTAGGERHAVDSDLVIGTTDIVIDLERSTVRIPNGSGFDPGGIGKGLAADIIVTMLIDRGADGACVNLGGDLRVEGHGPAGDSWTVAVDHPHRDVPLGLLTLSGGGVATSTTLKRRWTVGGEPRHHLIDPATGAPATTDVELMSVVAGQAWLAEAMATASLLRGRDRMFDLLAPDEAALAVLADGSTVTTPSIEPFLAPVRRDRASAPARAATP